MHQSYKDSLNCMFPKRSSEFAVLCPATLFIISILFSRVTVNVLVFVLRVVFFHLIVYIVTRYVYDAVRRDFAL